MRFFGLMILTLLCSSGTTICQTIVGFPALSRLDTTSYSLKLNTDSAAVITVHVSEDTTYAHSLIFLGRTVGETNAASIKMEGLRKNADYFYRVFIGTKLSSIGGSFSTEFP